MIHYTGSYLYKSMGEISTYAMMIENTKFFGRGGGFSY